jgi:uncharacterized protein YbgA (DUF1722 family)
MERVRIYSPVGMPSKTGRGLFADVLISHFEALPVEEEGRLNDARLRENFVERVFAYHRLRSFFAERWTLGTLVAFHTAHKLQLLAHSPAEYRKLGRLVADSKEVPRSTLRATYVAGFMLALSKRATPRKHVNVLHHILGHFRGRLDDEARAELRSLIDDYREGLIPLVVPITLLGHYVRKLSISYLSGQLYLEPHPKELMLRNHV